MLQFKPFVWSPTERRIAGAVSVDDLRRIARRRTPRSVFDYTEGGAGTELTMARNEAALRRVELRPRALRDVSAVDPSTKILGAHAELPLIVGPTGFTRMMHPAGEVAVARAAARAGLPYVLSMMGTTSPEALAEAAPAARRWFQLYIWKDRAAIEDLVARAQASGFDTLVLTVDTPVAGPRLRDTRNGMTIPPTLTLRTILNGARYPSWWLNFLSSEPLEFASLTRFGGTVAELAEVMFDPSATFAEVEWLRSLWHGRLMVKGILDPDDAERAVAAGADAILVSNHGGRQLDRAPASLDRLEDVVARVGGQAEVHVDGGVRSGSDVAAAVALGADGAAIGRAYLYGLMAGGERGVDRVLELVREELVNTMRLLGAKQLTEVRGAAMLRDPVT